MYIYICDMTWLVVQTISFSRALLPETSFSKDFQSLFSRALLPKIFSNQEVCCITKFVKTQGRSTKKLCLRPATLPPQKACRNKEQKHKEAVSVLDQQTWCLAKACQNPSTLSREEICLFFGSGAGVRCHESRARCHEYNFSPELGGVRLGHHNH